MMCVFVGATDRWHWCVTQSASAEPQLRGQRATKFLAGSCRQGPAGTTENVRPIETVMVRPIELSKVRPISQALTLVDVCAFGASDRTVVRIV